MHFYIHIHEYIYVYTHIYFKFVFPSLSMACHTQQRTNQCTIQRVIIIYNSFLIRSNIQMVLIIPLIYYFFFNFFYLFQYCRTQLAKNFSSCYQIGTLNQLALIGSQRRSTKRDMTHTAIGTNV